MRNKRRLGRGVIGTALGGAASTALISAGAYYGSQYIPSAVMAGLMKYAIGLVGVVWLFSLSVYNKLSDVTDLPGIDYKQHRSLEFEVQSRLQWFWVRAFFLAIVALLMYVPSLLTDARLAVPSWIYTLSGGALGLAIFSLRRLLSEMEEIRELRSQVKELERRERDRSETVNVLGADIKSGWTADQRLNGFRRPPPDR